MKTKILFFKACLLLLILTLPVNCRNSGNDSAELINAVEVTKLQMITLDCSGAKVGTTYDVTLNSLPAVAYANENNRITIFISEKTELGTNILNIAALNKKINLNVTSSVLNDSVTNVMKNYTDQLDTYALSLPNVPENTTIKLDIENFKKIFQSASPENQMQMALFYQVNKSIYDRIVKYNYEDISGKGTDYDENFEANVNHNKYKAAVLTLGISVAAMILIPHPFIKVVAFTAILISIKKALAFGKMFINEQMIIIDTNISEKLTPIFVSDQQKTVNLNVKRRNINSSDSSSKLQKLASFFLVFADYNAAVEKRNTVVQWLNSNIPFASFSITSQESIPVTSANTQPPVSIAYFKRYTFSIPSADASLVNVSFNNDGKINVTAKINNTNLTTVHTNLNYNYKDDYNEFSGSIPIQITKDNNILTGIWTMDFTLAAPNSACDEIDLEDESEIPATFHFNNDNTIFFDTAYDIDVLNDVNSIYTTRQYEFTNNILKITIHFKKGNEESYNKSTLTYNPQTKIFTGTYNYRYWYDGQLEQDCNNAIKIFK